MRLLVKIGQDERPTLLVHEEPWIRGMGVRFPLNGTWHHDGDGGLSGGPWEEGGGEDHIGAYREWCRGYILTGEPLLSLTLRAYDEAVWVTVELQRDLAGLSRTDSFDEATFLAPAFSFPEELRFFLATFGLGPSGEGHPGGYWPTAHVGRGPEELPVEAFAPLVCFSERGALAIAPANYFLTSPLVRVPGGAARGLHGAVDALAAGTRLETVFAFGENLPAALMRLGDLLLARGGKERPCAGDHLLTSSLGWWNAYGGYYTELFHPMDAQTLEELSAHSRAEGIPVRYLGLDLWYPYQEIGQAIHYTPDPTKYPEGLAGIAERTGLPYVLHLSALATENAYGADGADPEVYQTIAREIKREGGIGAWHDWLRTQQHLSPSLRADPNIAERWFSGMAEAFEKEGLAVLLCMQTMGMNLAATAHQNIIAARTYTDYLFGQSQQLENLVAQGMAEFEKERTTRQAYIFNNVLLGMVFHALGMHPFHDLFITNSRHSERFGDKLAKQEALLRALSAGPVGIGDRIGEVDKTIVSHLVLPDGTLAKPDHPLYPVQESLGEDIFVAYTETCFADEIRWIYLVVFNLGEEERSYRVDINRIYGSNYLIYDYFAEKLVLEAAGTLQASRARYYVLVPNINEIGLLGFADKFVTMPAGSLVDLRINKQGIQAVLSVPKGGIYPLAAFSHTSGLTVTTDNGTQVLKVTRLSNLHVAWVKPKNETFSIHFSR